MLFDKITETPPLPPITKEIAMEIYYKFKELSTTSHSAVFEAMNSYTFSYIVEAKDEIDRLENIVMTAMNSENKPQSKEELREMLSSDLIDCDIVLQDIIDYILVFEENTTWEDFIDQFIKDEGVII